METHKAAIRNFGIWNTVVENCGRMNAIGWEPNAILRTKSDVQTRRNEQEEIFFMVAKVTDDFLVAGKLEYIHEFMDRLQKMFTVGKVINDRFHFNGCEIQQNQNGDIGMAMTRYLDQLRPTSISRSPGKQRNIHANYQETNSYRAFGWNPTLLGKRSHA